MLLKNYTYIRIIIIFYITTAVSVLTGARVSTRVAGQLLGEAFGVSMKTAGRLKKRKRDDGAGAGSCEPSVADIRGMRVSELRAELSKRGLPTGGRKQELARRLEVAVTGAA